MPRTSGPPINTKIQQPNPLHPPGPLQEDLMRIYQWATALESKSNQLAEEIVSLRQEVTALKSNRTLGFTGNVNPVTSISVVNGLVQNVS